jgi:formyltetrahydrofolate synthetase
VVAGKPLDSCLVKEDLRAIEEGICNLEKQIENIRLFGIPVVVAINKFACDTAKEIELVKKRAAEFGAFDCCVSEVWSKGSEGGLDLAKAVVRASQEKKKFKFLYPLDIPIKEKIKLIAGTIYGSRDIEYCGIAEEKIKVYTSRGWDKLPICMAKTHLSLSHDPRLKGRPRDFVLPIRDMRASVGAGFLYPLCGTMQTMPGLPSRPVGEDIDIDEEGNIIGLS